MNGEFMDYSGDMLSDMRLLIEGALCIYEIDALPLCKLARDNGMKDALMAWDTIGNALYKLRDFIRSFQQEHIRQV